MATHANDADPGQSLAVTALFAALSPEFREAVVMRALRYRGQVSGDAGRALDSAIRGSLRIPEYRNSDAAPPHVLAEPVARGMFHSERLAGAALRVWAESHDPLLKIVADHLEAEALPAEYPDLPENGFRGVWDGDAWERQLDWIDDLSSDWDQDDLALMLCYVSGKTIIGPEDEEDDEDADAEDEEPAATYREDAGPQERAAASVVEPARPPPAAVIPERPPEPEPAPPPAIPETPPAIPATPEPPPVVVRRPVPESPPPTVVRRPVTAAAPAPEGEALLFRCLAWLELLPAAAPEWEASVASFVAAVNQIYEENQSHKERFAGLRQTLAEIAAEFAAELDFLEQDTAEWSVDRLNDLAAVNRMLERAAELKSLLSEYRQVHRPAASLSEELPRRERQNRLERQLLRTLGQMARQMAGDRGDGDGPATEGETAAGPASEDDPAELPPSPEEDPVDPTFQGELVYEPVEDTLPVEPPPTPARENPTPTARPRARRASNRPHRNP